jgi:hypothetical protein
VTGRDKFLNALTAFGSSSPKRIALSKSTKAVKGRQEMEVARSVYVKNLDFFDGKPELK